MTTRLVCLCLGLGVLPFAAGCVEDVKAAAVTKPAESTTAVGNPPRPLADLPTTDPLVAHAVLAKEQVVELEDELLGRLDDLRAILASAKADPERLRQSVAEFLDLTTDVRRKTLQGQQQGVGLLSVFNQKFQ